MLFFRNYHSTLTFWTFSARHSNTYYTKNYIPKTYCFIDDESSISLLRSPWSLLSFNVSSCSSSSTLLRLCFTFRFRLRSSFEESSRFCSFFYRVYGYMGYFLYIVGFGSVFGFEFWGVEWVENGQNGCMGILECDMMDYMTKFTIDKYFLYTAILRMQISSLHNH
jgi:hypothetical protein